MTSIMNLPACYHIRYSELFAAWMVCYQKDLIAIIKGKEEAEQAAREHYAMSQGE